MSVKFKMTNVSKTYQDGKETINVLENVSMQVNAGEFVAIVGPSGSGKSTFLSIAGALLSPTSGEVEIGGVAIEGLSKKEWTKLRLEKIGFIFQGANLIPYLTVEDQLKLIPQLAGSKSSVDSHELLSSLGLAHRLKQYPQQLSGGEKQRVAIGRALMNNPDLILADEPTASLDAERGYQVVEMLAKEVHEHNKAAIMVTHDERVLALVDRVLRIENGTITSETGHKKNPS
ncbi:hemin ABC transporter ATP-binding protein [Brochothrix thermosphacta]|uniref:ABC transporter ATP-binding protein n=1 Tax=Brochothrix thermosphacta TaxID=2756 RepID=UPI00083F597E|nr:ABC transporter ATP-binding protein [Brochothrix thermosphacta]ODJ54008.1 hemin ABC transporter ATP-binding protein [Brochothrix thermosphacta]ODJ59094.1 hemin ABC transporter ATP-binding protein [Brochothrix thermosphacta]